jgi:hypothetical protein
VVAPAGSGFRWSRLWLLALLPLLVVVMVALAGRRPQPAVVIAAPNAFGGPVNGGCYLATATTCKIRVDHWSPVMITSGARLEKVQLWANGQLLYDFRTDLANAPTGSYQLSPVRQDFAARCDQSYVLDVLVQDSDDDALVSVGLTNPFTCPAGEAELYALFLPGVFR